ncbi:MAG: uracil-DNA glycosylase [bacterium]|nr:uracil-DNA glycosylase [bacterium]
MPTRDQLLAQNDELRRLKAGGQRAVAVTEESLAQLRESVAASGSEAVASAAPAPVAVPIMTFSTESRNEPAPRVPAPSAPSLPAPPPINLPEGDKPARWNHLRELVLHDSVCRARVFAGKQVVFGVGNLDAAVMFVGEAPGGDEEDQGEPFVGRAGQLLNRMIKAMGLERSQVYIGNILNWRPEMGTRNADGSQTGNRPPTAAEMSYCLPFIRAQIAIIQPKVLVALGKTAVDGLLGADRFKTMGAARGTWHSYADKPLRASYHPSYLLRQEGLTSASAKKIKRDAWEDLLAVMERAELPVTEKQRNYFR